MSFISLSWDSHFQMGSMRSFYLATTFGEYGSLCNSCLQLQVGIRMRLSLKEWRVYIKAAHHLSRHSAHIYTVCLLGAASRCSITRLKPQSNKAISSHFRCAAVMPPTAAWRATAGGLATRRPLENAPSRGARDRPRQVNPNRRRLGHVAARW